MTPLQLGKYSNYKKQYSKDIIFMESKNAKINNAKKQEYNELKAVANELYNDCIEVEISKGLVVTFYKKR
jgi:hypothetical protein